MHVYKTGKYEAYSKPLDIKYITFILDWQTKNNIP